MPATNSFTDAIRAQASMPHPHLESINPMSFLNDRSVVTAKAQSLLSYQQYLATVRAQKAKSQSVSPAFERNVQAQARQALADAQDLSAAALRITQQASQTSFWSQVLNTASATLESTGPVTVQQLWNEINQNLQDPQNAAQLAAAGLTSEMAAAITSGIPNVNASLLLHNGKVSVQTQIPGESQTRILSLRIPGGPPSGITDLLNRAQFEQVLSVFNNQAQIYLEALGSPGGSEYEPAQLFAFGAVFARQRLAEHLRKLEDTGLDTYQGNDPVTFITVLVFAGIALGGIGAAILYACDPQPAPPGTVTTAPPPGWECTAGLLMVLLGAICLGIVAINAGSIVAGFAGQLVAEFGLFGFAVLIVDFVEHARNPAQQSSS
ncbi:MAG TPA: hypothetical protein VGF08_13550 [Terriglobales bacterium]|jgi:hypothetical protein